MKFAPVRLGVFCLSASLCGASIADVVTDWNEIAVGAGYTARVSGEVHSRAVAMVEIAVFEALNTIEPRYMPYRSAMPRQKGASVDAAAANAAHDVLVNVFPEQSKDFDLVLQRNLAAIAEGPAKVEGILLGQRTAAAIIAERANDHSKSVNTYRPSTTAGKYVPTALPISSTASGMTPFSLKSGDQFRPGPPYSLTSELWARDYNESKSLGAKDGSKRTPEQTEIARFWQLIGPATYNPVVLQIAKSKGLDALDRARLFALVSIATADAVIAVFDAKYTYEFWRPITAIRNGDIDGNDATQRDASWEPFAMTPMHPEYPCAHCIVEGSAASVMQTLYGDNITTFTLTSSTAPGVTRTYARLSDYVADVINGRVYEGVHYRTSGVVGAEMGQKIGAYVVQNYFKPL